MFETFAISPRKKLFWLLPDKFFDKWGKSYEKSLQTFNTFFENSCVAMPTFSVIFVPSGSEREDFSIQTD